VYTKNSTYELIIGNNEVIVQGGKFFPEPTKAILNGSTWGGSMIKLGWIGYGMCMEIARPGLSCVTTSPVRDAKIIGPNYDYTMEWGEKS
jgi:hypothetical protein